MKNAVFTVLAHMFRHAFHYIALASMTLALVATVRYE